MNYNETWNEIFCHKLKKSYPAEQLIRIFMGSYPKIKFDKIYYDKKVLDIGCANGRNTEFLASLCFKEVIAIDITEELINLARLNVESAGNYNNCKYMLGTNDCIPLDSNYLDFAVSWGVSYYMTLKDNGFSKYGENLKELARVLKKDGVLIIDVPQYNADVYDNTEAIDEFYFKDKNGFILRRFQNEEDFTRELSKYFYDIQLSTLTLDCFGKNYSRYTIVCRRI